MTTTKRMTTTGEGQRILGEFVSREVFYSVSALVYEITRGDYANERAVDDLADVLTQQDWHTAAKEKGVGLHQDSGGEGWSYTTTGGGDTRTALDANTEAAAWREAAEAENIDPYDVEAYEHWVISDWLARKLAAHGEMTMKFCGLTIWGRTCTGQSIALDSVIEDIYRESHPHERDAA